MPPRKPSAPTKTPARRAAKAPAKTSAKVASTAPARAPAQALAAVIPPPEVIAVPHGRVACDGGGGALGHPLVYLELGADGVAECGYCDRRFVLTPGAGDAYHDPSPRALEAH